MHVAYFLVVCYTFFGDYMYIDLLTPYIDEKYKKFSEKLFSVKPKMLGVRIPTLKKLAKNLNIDLDNLDISSDLYMEEKFIILFYICSLKDKIKYLDLATLFVDNWSLCDSFCSAFKITGKEKETVLKWILEQIKSDSEYRIRIGLVLLKNYYIEDKYLSVILKICTNLKSNYYYVNMALAWLIQCVYLKYPKEIVLLLSKKTLSSFVQNKTISKICDSKVVSLEEKNNLKKYKS